jgi:CDP-diacylglycerol--glycerol-3-phosphate 3-phosphatidyltransferase
LVAAATDWLDGYLARRLDLVSDLGKFLDPLVDKLLVLGPLMSLVELGQLPAWGVFLILARELTIAGWRVTPQQTADGVQGANFLGKVKTVVQMTAIALLIAPLPWWGERSGAIAFWIALALTWISGWFYLQPALAPVAVKPPTAS